MWSKRVEAKCGEIHQQSEEEFVGQVESESFAAAAIFLFAEWRRQLGVVQFHFAIQKSMTFNDADPSVEGRQAV
jgi:hypothetical protein